MFKVFLYSLPILLFLIIPLLALIINSYKAIGHEKLTFEDRITLFSSFSILILIIILTFYLGWKY